MTSAHVKTRRHNNRKPREQNASPERIAMIEKQARALQLRQAGLTFREIAVQLNYKTAAGASNAVQAALADNISPVVEEYRKLNLARLETMLGGLWPHVLRGNDHQLIGEARRVIHDISELVGAYHSAPTLAVSVEVSDEAKATVGVGITWTPDADWMREFAKAYDEIHPGEYDSVKLLETLTDEGAAATAEAPAGAHNGTAA